ncbi:MAG TPA: hypothetical protein VGV18_10850 [Verrucomicrobiae bacterium]|nr:hypothetical protein [Verrucomicrobiae bacterium]
MGRILAAAAPEARLMVEGMLAGHAITYVSSLAQAQACLRQQSFDLIFCGVLFDESRMLELLRLTKSDPDWERIPFVCARIKGKILSSPKALKTAAFTAQVLGASAFVDARDCESDPRRLRLVIDEVLEGK